MLYDLSHPHFKCAPQFPASRRIHWSIGGLLETAAI
jgi:hypothetical protein